MKLKIYATLVTVLLVISAALNVLALGSIEVFSAARETVTETVDEAKAGLANATDVTTSAVDKVKAGADKATENTINKACSLADASEITKSLCAKLQNPAPAQE